MGNTTTLGNKTKLKELLDSFGLPRLIIAGFLLLLMIAAPIVGLDFATQITNIITRFSWNAVMVLAMVPMVHAGCGLNFGLPLGIVSGLLGATLSIELGFTGFTVRVNDRQILKAMAQACQFEEADFDKVFIILDKMDKIGLEGVKKELLDAGFAQESVEKYVAWFERAGQGLSAREFCGEGLADVLDPKVLDGLDEILSCVQAGASGDFKLAFDPTLVRGMSYYTGTIFEVELPGFSGSIAGGGRYDEMVGHFCGQKVCACGFSIGFERIITILKDQGYQIPDDTRKVAFLAENGLSAEKKVAMFQEAAALRAEGVQVMVTTRAKNAKHQKETLRGQGYEEFKEFFRRED